MAAVSGLVVSVVVLAPSARAEGEVVITEEARTHFAAGVALLQDPKAPRYEEAYREFKTAYAASPSYKILGNLGLCAMKIERGSVHTKPDGRDRNCDERDQRCGMIPVNHASAAAARENATSIPMRILTRHLTERCEIQNPRLASVAQAFRFAGTD